jgi:hypothetical protein
MVDKDGQYRRYRSSAQEPKTVHDWPKYFRRFWTEHLRDVKEAAERKARERSR